MYVATKQDAGTHHIFLSVKLTGGQGSSTQRPVQREVTVVVVVVVGVVVVVEPVVQDLLQARLVIVGHWSFFLSNLLGMNSELLKPLSHNSASHAPQDSHSPQQGLQALSEGTDNSTVLNWATNLYGSIPPSKSTCVTLATARFVPVEDNHWLTNEEISSL